MQTRIARDSAPDAGRRSRRAVVRRVRAPCPTAPASVPRAVCLSSPHHAHARRFRAPPRSLRQPCLSPSQLRPARRRTSRRCPWRRHPSRPLRQRPRDSSRCPRLRRLTYRRAIPMRTRRRCSLPFHRPILSARAMPRRGPRCVHAAWTPRTPCSPLGIPMARRTTTRRRRRRICSSTSSCRKIVSAAAAGGVRSPWRPSRSSCWSRAWSWPAVRANTLRGTGTHQRRLPSMRRRRPQSMRGPRRRRLRPRPLEQVANKPRVRLRKPMSVPKSRRRRARGQRARAARSRRPRRRP